MWKYASLLGMNFHKIRIYFLLFSDPVTLFYFIGLKMKIFGETELISGCWRFQVFGWSSTLSITTAIFVSERSLSLYGVFSINEWTSTFEFFSYSFHNWWIFPQMNRFNLLYKRAKNEKANKINNLAKINSTIYRYVIRRRKFKRN